MCEMKLLSLKRYTDGIIWLLYDYFATTKTKKIIQAQFEDFNLQLVFNIINIKKN